MDVSIAVSRKCNIGILSTSLKTSFLIFCETSKRRTYPRPTATLLCCLCCTFRAATNAQTPCTTAAPEVSPRPAKAPGAIPPDSPITMPPPEEECPQPVPPLSRLSTNSTTVCCYVVFICPGLLHCIALVWISDKYARDCVVVIWPAGSRKYMYGGLDNWDFETVDCRYRVGAGTAQIPFIYAYSRA